MFHIVGGRGQYVEFQGHANSPADASFYSFANQPLGNPFKNRLIIIGVSNYALFGRQVNAVTVAGVSAVLHARSPFPNPYSDIWSATVPTGETGTINLSLGGNSVDMTIGIWSAYGLVSPVAFNATSQSQANPGQLNLAVPSNGFAIVNAVQLTTPGLARGITWEFPELGMNPTGDFVNAQGSANGASRAKLPDTPIFTVKAYPASGSVTMAGTTWR